MELRSLGLTTDIMLSGWDGVVEDHPDHRVIRSPDNPDFWFGNYLLFPEPPSAADAPRWIAQFRTVFATDPRVSHVLLRWDRPDGAAGALAPFVAMGFGVDHEVVMTARSARRPLRPNHAVTCRALADDDDWEQATRLQIATSREQYAAPESFGRALMARYRRLVAAGRGLWFGAFDDSRLVADLGIFVDGGLARFQMVETARAHRGRGICGTLVHHVAEVALQDLGAKRLVMVSDPAHPATRVYGSVGFEAKERLVAVLRRPD